MRYALVSDIHSNLEAFEAVLEAISKDNPDKYLCLGDIVGYGADPEEAVRLTQFLKTEAIVAGNHDWGVAGLLDLEYFSEEAAAAVLWTKGALNNSQREYLASFPLIYETKGFTLVHGTLEMPSEFHYIHNSGDAYVTAHLSKTPICFVGHSHVPAIFRSDEGPSAGSGPVPSLSRDGKMELVRSSSVKTEPDKKYVVNVGSVGQPRDGDPRAAYVIYDDSEGTIDIKRVSYSTDTTREKILKAGLPPFLAHRLSEGK
jgi:predicted phosphodiesterase